MKIRKNIAISESGFVFDPATGDSYSLNNIGAEILEMLKQDKEFKEISNEITTKYDIESSAFEKYYNDFVSMLEQFQLFED